MISPRVASLATIFSSVVSFSSSLLAAIPAFPGAEGYGAYATGGRGGDVYHVTNLNASGTGSFADAIATVPAAGRTIVFDVSGYIRLPSGSNGTRLTASKVTIAGQTAPGDGIGFYNNFFRISGDDIVIRHLRFRHGKYGSGGDCIDLDSGTLNAILDHVSMQFSTDENMSSFGSPPENLTLQYSLNAWGLESHSCGGLWDQNHATSHHNLWAHNHTRNPKARPNGLLEWINNVTFDWDIGFIMGDSQSNQNWYSNVINNYFIGPPGNTQSKTMVKGTVADNGKPNFTIFLSGNLTDNDGDGLLNGIDKGYSVVEGTSYAPGTTGLTPGAKAYYQATGIMSGSTVGVTTDSPLLAYKKIVSNAGPLRLDAAYTGTLRDEVDTILFNKLVTQTPFHVTRESDTGASNSGFGVLSSTAAPIDTDRDGMPDSYEDALGWNSSVQDHNTVVTGTTFLPSGSPAGYTRLEEYLHFLSVPHLTIQKNTATSPDIDLTRFTSGFSNSPVFTISNVTGGTVTQSGTGGKLVHFTAQATAGRGGFLFTVTDADGSVWTQQFAICVASTGLPSDLMWKGDGTTNSWDTAASNWLKAGVVSTFANGDRVTFNDSGSKSPAISVPSGVVAGSFDVNSSGTYTFTGAGAISSSSNLTKRGSGGLILSNTGGNSFANVSLEEGTLTVNSSTGLGSAAINFSGGNLALGPASNSTISSALKFSTAATITPTSQHTESGNWTGTNQTVTISGGSVLWTVAGTWTGFTGSVKFGNSSVRMRLNNTSNINYGSTAVAVDLGSNDAQFMNRNGITVDIGSLESTGAATQLQGTQSGSTASTYSIGALNTSTTFAGIIANGGSATTNITKVGTGTLTLSGANTYTGATTISGGGLLVSGSLGTTAVSVASGATLSGAGTIGGAVSVASGGKIAPGNSIGAAGNLTVGSLALTTATLPFDLSSNPSGTNDHIQLAAGGALSVTGVQTFQFNLVDGTLGAGTYKLIETTGTLTASSATLASNLPTGARQTFTLQRNGSGTAPGYIQLVVSGTAASLFWTGSSGGIWDTNTTSAWSNAGSADKFFNFDAVNFDDTATSGSVTIGTAVAPRSLTVNNSTRAYTLSGAGIGGTGSLIKNGPGTLTLSPISVSLSSTTTTSSTTVTLASTTGLSAGMAVSGTGIAAGTTIASITDGTTLVLSLAATASGTVSLSYVAANTYTGGTFLNGGTIVLATDNANSYGLGTGPVTFANGTTLTMYNNASGDNTAAWGMIVPAGVSATLNADSRVTLSGSLVGGGTLNMWIPFVRTSITGDWSAFTGTINVTTDGDGGDFRFGTAYSYPGFPAAAIVLPAKVSMYYIGTISSGAGTTITVGELSGAVGSTLLGGPTGGRALTYRIGGRNTDATFAGSIGEQGGISGGNITSYVKTGTGTWTLSGTCAYNGGTTVEQGTLRILGSLTSNGGQLDVAAAAALKLEGGTVVVDSTNIAANALLIGNGTITGDLNNNGTVSSTTGGTLTVTGSVVNTGSMVITNGSTLQIDGDMVNTGTLALTAGGQLAGAGTVENNGIIDMMTGLQSLPVNFVNTGIVLDSSKVVTTACSVSGSAFTVSLKGYAGHSYQLQKSGALGSTAVWQNVGAAVPGTGALDGAGTSLDLVDSGVTGSKNFYRVVVTP